jgi:hypothetical protein
VIPAAPWRIKELAVLPGYRLAVIFQDDTGGAADLSAITTARDCGLCEALKDQAVFAQARLDPGVVVWPTGADLDPAWMYERIREGKTWPVPI